MSFSVYVFTITLTCLYQARHVWWLPNTIFGSCGLLAGVLVHLLPETKGLSLCETTQDVDERARRNKNKKIQESDHVDLDTELNQHMCKEADDVEISSTKENFKHKQHAL